MPWVNLRDMIERSQATTPAELQEFFNSDLGEPFLAPHGSFSLDEFDRLRADYKVGDYRGQPYVMDVDPGTELHVVVRERLGETGDRSRLWFAGTVGSFEELDGLFKRYHVHTAVIDAQPEQHAARQFAESHPGTFVSYYTRTEGDHEFDPSTGVVHANRTLLLDQLLDRMRKGELPIPAQGRIIGGPGKDHFGGYYTQLLVPKRVLMQDASGNWVARWAKTTNPITMPTRRATASSPSSARADLVPACGSSSRGSESTPQGCSRVLTARS